MIEECKERNERIASCILMCKKKKKKKKTYLWLISQIRVTTTPYYQNVKILTNKKER